MNTDDAQMNNYDFDSLLKESGGSRLYRQFLQRVERPLIEWSLKRAWGNQIKAAKLLGLNRNTIRAKIKRLGIDPQVYK
jgi:two-component system nitrogen regulation response regulator GlnG